jgi:hypothetical protein
MIDMTPVIDFSSADQTEVATVRIPAGLWLRSGPARCPADHDLAFRTVPEGGRFTLLVGAPGESTPTVPELVEVFGSLEPVTQNRLVLTVYGPEPAGPCSLAQQLAEALLRPVRAAHGLLVGGSAGPARRIAVDLSGSPSWEPFAQLSTYRPGRTAATVDRWRAPFSGASAIGPGSYRLTPDWTIDVVPAGLVVRPTRSAPDPALSSAPTDPHQVDLVVDAPDGARLTDEMLTSLGRVADVLPTAARERLRVVVTERVAAASVRELRWAVPAPQVTWR